MLGRARLMTSMIRSSFVMTRVVGSHYRDHDIHLRRRRCITTFMPHIRPPPRHEIGKWEEGVHWRTLLRSLSCRRATLLMVPHLVVRPSKLRLMTDIPSAWNLHSQPSLKQGHPAPSCRLAPHHVQAQVEHPHWSPTHPHWKIQVFRPPLSSRCPGERWSGSGGAKRWSRRHALRRAKSGDLIT